MKDRTYNVLVVDDEWLDREGLRDQIIAVSADDLAVSIAKNTSDALRAIEIMPCDILFTDICMPGLSGIELARKVRSASPDTVVIFVSGYDDFEYARQAITVEAVYYLLKPVADDELVKALEIAIARTDDRLAGQTVTVPAAGPFPLTDAGIARRIFEKVDEILRAKLAEDITLKSIADKLHYTPNHLGKLFNEGAGMRFVDFLTALRMNKAAFLIKSEPELRVAQVAEAVGYKNSDAFTHQFYLAFGVLPKSGKAREK